MASDAKATAAYNKQRFTDAWPGISDELTAFLKQHQMPENAIQWFTKVGVLWSFAHASMLTC